VEEKDEMVAEQRQRAAAPELAGGWPEQPRRHRKEKGIERSVTCVCVCGEGWVRVCALWSEPKRIRLSSRIRVCAAIDPKASDVCIHGCVPLMHY
jgi:hypothetical protein